MAFAAAVTKGRAIVEKCPGINSPISESDVYPVFDDKGRLVNSVFED